MLIFYYYTFFSNHRLTGVVVPLAGQTDGRMEEQRKHEIYKLASEREYKVFSWLHR